jgi:AcrR family transcriptional regulator
MYKLCKTEQSAKRQREIEHRLLALMKQKHFDDISITELCEFVGMPRKSFYRYFDSKEDALEALIDHTLGEYSGFNKTPAELKSRTPRREMEEYFLYWKSMGPLLDVLERSGRIGVLMDRAVAFPINDVVNMDKFLVKQDEFSKSVALKFAFAGLSSVMLAWYRDGCRTPVSDMAAAVCIALTKPLFPGLENLGNSGK